MLRSTNVVKFLKCLRFDTFLLYVQKNYIIKFLFSRKQFFVIVFLLWHHVKLFFISWDFLVEEDVSHAVNFLAMNLTLEQRNKYAVYSFFFVACVLLWEYSGANCVLYSTIAENECYLFEMLFLWSHLIFSLICRCGYLLALIIFQNYFLNLSNSMFFFEYPIKIVYSYHNETIKVEVTIIKVFPIVTIQTI